MSYVPVPRNAGTMEEPDQPRCVGRLNNVAEHRLKGRKNMRHFIIVKFKDTVDKQTQIKPITELFKEAEKINGVETVKVHSSNMNLPNRHDLMIEMELTPSALKAFDESEIHKQWKAEYGNYIANKTIFDCD